MNAFLQILFIVFSYLLGAVPFGLLFSRVFSNVDVRTIGSGNIGATNVLRAAGKKAALFTLLADCFKGLLPVAAGRFLLHNDDLAALSGVAAIVGHNFPVYLGFKGGKGVATSFGVMLAASPWTGLLCLCAWLASAYFWRYSSLAALIASALYPVITFSVGNNSPSLGFLSLFISGMIYYRHRENIKRLLSGTEPRIGKK